jgi:hypothetical protein
VTDLSEAHLEDLIKRLEVQAERVGLRYLQAVERMADATDHSELDAAIGSAQDVARHSQIVGQILSFYQHHKKQRAEAKLSEARMS